MIAVPSFRGFVKVFVISCAAVFILEQFSQVGAFARHDLFNQLLRFLGLVPELFFQGMIYQAITWIFIHWNLWHLLFNMLAFWMFGSLLQDLIGDRRFCIFTLVSGAITGALVATIGLFDASMYSIPTIGASGVVFALLIAVSRIFPNQVVLFMFIFPMKLRYFALLLLAIEFFALYSSNQHGISNTAHLSGALVGFIYAGYFMNKNSTPGSQSGGILEWFKKIRENARQRKLRKRLRIVRSEETKRWN
jgi:membrane associated rhomboid family serine protease